MIRRLFHRPWFQTILALLAVVLYVVQSFVLAHTMDVTMDEGTYLTKGLLFVRGVYRPFQEYGPLTNKMPLSYLIPGLAQAVFEPGLRTGRYFSIFLSLLMLAGLWWLTRRLAGKGWAIAILWISALNPANLANYTQALSQVVTACLLIWSLVFVLGRDRSGWQISLGTLLAVAVVLTRQNMAPVIPFIVAYVYWEHGWRKGTLALVVSLAALVVSHAIYWPGIMQIWVDITPSPFKHWLFARFIVSRGGGVSLWRNDLGAFANLFSFWEGVRFNFLGFVGSVLALLVLPRCKDWKKAVTFRASMTLAAMLTVLIAVHLYGALGKDYCTFCFSRYMTFFSPLLILLVFISFSSWQRKVHPVRQTLIAGVILLCSIGIGFGAYQHLGGLLTIRVPRVKELRMMPGSTELWRLLSNKFGLTYEQLQVILPTVAGALFGILFLMIVYLVYRIMLKRGQAVGNYGFILSCSFLMIGTLLSPTGLLSGGKLPSDCGGDVIASHEAVGSHLRQLIPPEARVYWMNDVSPLPLLYLLPENTIYPPQLNHWYTYLKGGDPEKVYRLGFWNDELDQQWRAEADYLLVAERYVKESFYNNLAQIGHFDELAPTPQTVPCRDRSIIHVFRRVW
jgi:hypothetical protein